MIIITVDLTPQVSINDSLPTKLCRLCKQRLIDAYIFKQKCSKSAKLLRKILKLPDEIPLDAAEEQPVETSDASTMTCLSILSTKIDNVDHPSTIEHSVEENLQEMFGLDDKEQFIDVLEVADVKHMIQFDPSDDQFLIAERVHISMEDDEVELEQQSDGVIQMEVNTTDIYEELSMEEPEKQFIIYSDSECVGEPVTVPIADEAIKNSRKSSRKIRKENCIICNAVVASTDILSHIADHEDFLPRVISTTEFFRCNHCRRVYPSTVPFIAHLDSESCTLASLTPKPDDYTDYQFLDDSPDFTLENVQLITCSISQDDKFLCDCAFATDSFATFTDHYKSQHMNNQDVIKETCRQSHTCGICEVTFENLKETIFHSYYHQSQYVCPVTPCGKIFFNSYNSLRRHIEREHIEGLVFPCQYCKEEFVGYDRLKAHLRKECKARQVACNYCGRKFFQKQTLLVHERNHKLDKKYKCEYCPKTFAQLNDLRNHQRLIEFHLMMLMTKLNLTNAMNFCILL